MTWLDFIIAALVVYRLSLMLSKESGPGRIFQKLRRAAPPKSATREGLSCLHCESIWWSAPVTAFLWWTNRVAPLDTPLYWLALSGAAIVLHYAFTEDFKK